MTHEEKNRVPNLDTAIEAMRNDVPPETGVAAAGARVWARLQNADVLPELDQIRGCDDFRKLLPAYQAGKLGPSRSLLLEDHLRGCVACHEVARSGEARQVVWDFPKPASRWAFPRFAMAAAALVVLAVGSMWVARVLETPSGPRARVQSIQGSLYKVTSTGDQALPAGAELTEGEFVRTAGNSHAFVQLFDGSIVEMSERSAFSVTARRQDTTVHLDQGRIIVQAAKRKTGHLYVLTPDARVSVTGTVFAVNSGMKGSRVSVIEGEVHVGYSGKDDVLHSGDQAVTSSNLTTVPVQEEIAWSDNLQKHLELLAQFAILQKKFDQIPTPGLRYTSNILDRLPANTVVYASIPNLGDALKEANDIFQNQLQQSSVLREWWNKGHKSSDGLTFEQMVAKLHGLSQYLGDEVVLAGFSGNAGGGQNVVFIADLKNAGVRGYLDREFSSLVTHPDGKTEGLRVVDETELPALTEGSHQQLIAVVGDQFLLMSPSVNTLKLVNTQLKNGAGGLTGSAFGQRIQSAYQRGAGMMFAINLQQIIGEMRSRQMMTNPQHNPAALAASGFNDAQYLVVEHRDQQGAPDNRAVLAFAGPRHGIASWLAAPSPIRSLEFVSPNAGAAVSFLSKRPADMLEDMLQMTTRTAPRDAMAEANAKLHLDIRNDIAASLGGDVTLALDGPVLPKPSWKLIVQVYDPGRLQSALERMVQLLNDEAAKRNHAGVELKQEESGGQIFYSLRALDPKALGMEVDYTYSAGFLVAAPSRALVVSALSTNANKDESLARSAEFQALLPKDAHMNFSAVLYQNIAPLLKPLADQVSGQQMKVLTQLANDSKPSVICAYADNDRIEVASASKLLPFDLNSLGLASLLGRHNGGTSKAAQP